MRTIVICDDDEIMAHYVEEKVSEVFAGHGIRIQSKMFTNPNDALDYCEGNKTDYILLDLDMPEMTGFELTKKLYRLPDKMIPIVLYMSSHEQLVYESFQYRPFDFLRKSCLEEELASKIERLIHEYDYQNEQIELGRGEVAYVLLRDVFYFKSDRNNTDVFTEKEQYRCRNSITMLEEKYENCLIRTGRQYLVNVHYIKRIQADGIVLKNDTKVPMSRRQRRAVEEKYARLTRR